VVRGDTFFISSLQEIIIDGGRWSSGSFPPFLDTSGQQAGPANSLLLVNVPPGRSKNLILLSDRVVIVSPRDTDRVVPALLLIFKIVRAPEQILIKGWSVGPRHTQGRAVAQRVHIRPWSTLGKLIIELTAIDLCCTCCGFSDRVVS
jgi:hypothetical protein